MISPFAASAARITAAFVSRNPVPIADVPGLIRIVADTLAAVERAPEPAAVPAEHKLPAEIRRSQHDEYLISFLDGRRYKSLKRHLSTHGLGPQEYRTRFGLPHDYPMVCASYSRTRTALAKAMGLGRKATNAGPAAA